MSEEKNTNPSVVPFPEKEEQRARRLARIYNDPATGICGQLKQFGTILEAERLPAGELQLFLKLTQLTPESEDFWHQREAGERFQDWQAAFGSYSGEIAILSVIGASKEGFERLLATGKELLAELGMDADKTSSEYVSLEK